MRKKIISTITYLVALGAIATPNSGLCAISHYERGRELYEMGRWVDARKELTYALEELGATDHIKRQNVEYTIAMCAMKLDTESAESLLLKFERDYPQAPYTNDILFIRGLYQASNGNHELAMELLNDVNPDRLTDEDYERYNIRMGYLLFLDEEYDDSKQYLKNINSSSQYYPHALYCNSYIAYVEGDYRAAKSGFEELLTDQSYSPIVPFYLMQVEFLTGNYTRAIEYGEQLLESSLEQKQVAVVRTLAESYFRLGQYDESLNLIDRYIAAGGEVGREENYIKGFSLHQLGYYAEAIEPLRAVCGADDEMTQNASFHLANCYIHVGNKEEALRAFSMASNDGFNEQIAEEALFNQAKLQYELGDGLFNETINLLTRYVNKYDNPERLNVARTLLVAAYYNTRDYSTAYDAIAQIKNPDSEILAAKQKIAYLRGLEQFVEQDYDDAMSYLEESIDIGITPKQVALANYWLGEISYLNGNNDDALSKFNYFSARAPKGDPTTIEVLYSTAYALLQQGNTSSALQYFQRYVAAANAESRLIADSYNRIGDIYYGMRSFTSATRNYDRAIEIGDNGVNYAKYQKAIIKGVQGDQSGKVAELLSIVDPSEGEEYLDDALYELGRTYTNIGQYSKAIATFKEFLSYYPTSPLYASALSELGVAYINHGDSKSALAYYDKAINAAPQSQVAKDAMQGIREIYVSEGKAQSYFDYAESIGMEGDLNAVSRDSLSFASARGLYFSSDESVSKQKGAASALESYIESYPKGYYMSDALFLLSDCHIKMGNNKDAIETLTTLSERGSNQYSERVYDRLAQMTYAQGMYKESAAASRKLYDVAKDDVTRKDAMSRYVNATNLVGDQNAIREMCNEVLSLGESKVGTDATLEAKYALATILRTRGERDEALKLYKDLATSSSKHKGEANYYIIENLYRESRYDDAEKKIFEFADQPSADSYWLAKSFIMLGDIYAAEGDNFQARATYQSIVDGYSNQTDGVVEDAKAKISALK
ncbi:MAG: tetratricopeptide repeat protein [Rikenellaceae bacterium]